MKNFLPLWVCLLLLFSCHSRMMSQVKPEVRLVQATQKENSIRVQVSSADPFIVGNNYYVLHIGSKSFELYETIEMESGHSLMFLLSREEFMYLSEGAAVYLTYGPAVPSEENMEQLAAKTKTCWKLGTFTSSLLK